MLYNIINTLSLLLSLQMVCQALSRHSTLWGRLWTMQDVPTSKRRWCQFCSVPCQKVWGNSGWLLCTVKRTYLKLKLNSSPIESIALCCYIHPSDRRMHPYFVVFAASSIWTLFSPAKGIFARAIIPAAITLQSKSFTKHVESVGLLLFVVV